MDSERIQKKRMNVEEEVDRLSSLPDDLIHKILSFICIIDAIGTSTFSSRWRYIWTSMSCLDFSSEDFSTLPKFSKFVTQFLSRRNNQIEVSSLNLSFRGKVTQPFVKKLLGYANSHNLQQLNVSYTSPKYIEFPLTLFSSQSLKHLNFTLANSYIVQYLPTTSTLELPALTTLCLHDVSLCSDHDHTDKCFGFFSKCANLKNLTLRNCVIEGLSSFNICHHPGLANLALDGGLWGVKVVNVVAPQLENLIIRSGNNIREHVISAPDLTSLVYEGYHPLHLSTVGFPSLKKADISHLNSYNKQGYFYTTDKTNTKLEDAHEIVLLFQQLRNVEFLTLNLELIELLSSSIELISNQPSPFVNLKSLSIYPKKLYEEGLPKGKVNLSTEVKSYLLDSSPGATFTMFSRKEIIAAKDAASAQKLMAELRVLLEQEKANTKTNGANTNRGKAPMESYNAKMHKERKAQPEMKMQLQIGVNIALIKSCWKDLSVQFKQRKAKTCLIISMLKSIKGLLKKLPTTNRAMIQPCFSSLCAEANTVMSKIMKMQCDENQSHLSVCFHELATSTTMEPSS